MLQSIKEYKIRLERYGYSDEELKYVQDFKKKAKHLTFEQYDYLFKSNMLKRYIKLKKKRNLFFKDNKIYYLCHYNRKFEVVAEFKE